MEHADVHAHLDLFGESRLKVLVRNAEETGVKAIVTNSVDAATNRKVLRLQGKYRIVKAALGIYPSHAVEMSDDGFDREMKLMRKSSEQFAAFGEIGLDYEELEDRKTQQERFEKQLQLAENLGKPVIVHSRKAEKEVIETLTASDSKKVILHAFHGSMKLVKAAVENGFCFSIPSNITRSSHFRKMAEIVPLENLFTETDSPYFGPQKGGNSEPSYVALTVHEIAKIKNYSDDEAAATIFGNYLQLFGRKN